MRLTAALGILVMLIGLACSAGLSEQEVRQIVQEDSVPGPKGDRGDVGPQGPRGYQGDVGPQAPRGYQGDIGPQGPRGYQGDIGPQGPRGYQGDVGPQGPKGDAGNAEPVSPSYENYVTRPRGDLSCFPPCRTRSDPLGVAFDDFSVDATFINPTSTDLFEYGFTIEGAFQNGVSEHIEIRGANDRTWRAYIQKVVRGSAQVKIDQWQVEISGGEITGTFDTGVGGSNRLEVVVLGDRGCLRVNRALVSCFDLPGRTITKEILISSKHGDVRYRGFRAREALAEDAAQQGSEGDPGKAESQVPSYENYVASPDGKFISVSAGSDHTCGVTTDGAVVCWGSDRYGRASPLGGEFTSVDAGGRHTCGVTTDGAIVCWGEDFYGQASPPSGRFVSVSTGGYHTCGVKTDGYVACWGRNDLGQGRAPERQLAFVNAGPLHTCEVQSDGYVVCLGRNGYGQTGSPERRFASVSAGLLHTCGVKIDGSVACWGDDGHGKASPPEGRFASVSANSIYTCGVRTDGTIACWGIDRHSATMPPEGRFASVSACAGMPVCAPEP